MCIPTVKGVNEFVTEARYRKLPLHYIDRNRSVWDLDDACPMFRQFQTGFYQQLTVFNVFRYIGFGGSTVGKQRHPFESQIGIVGYLEDSGDFTETEDRSRDQGISEVLRI